MAFKNEPSLRDDNNDGKIRRYVHAPLAIEHYGIHAKIQENGKVIINKVADDQPEDKNAEVEYDEIEVPASLIFKLAMALKMTRSVKYVSLSELKPKEIEEIKNEQREG